MASVTIRDVRTIMTSPSRARLVVVKVETSEPGLHGVGCATFTQRHLAVKTAVDEFLRPFLLGKDVDRIEDLWETCYQNGYWRNGPVLNNALAGVDMALWDIKGKQAGSPVYQLLGGKCREAAACYSHADGREPKEVEDNVRALVAEGYQYVRVQMGGYGGRYWRNGPHGASSPFRPGRRLGVPSDEPPRRPPERPQTGAYYDPRGYVNSIEDLLDHLRTELGFDVELLHDVHERLAPIDAVAFAKALEPYRLYFLEDLFAPEDVEWFEMARSQTATPLAMGELFNHPREWTPLITGRLIDFMRMHISQMGGITPARKVATLGEFFGVRTAWHGPSDVSPVGHAANLHLDLACHNFGIQEYVPFTDAERAVFPGAPEVRGGYMYPNERPGLGIDVDEAEASKHPCAGGVPNWTLTRRPDGTTARP